MTENIVAKDEARRHGLPGYFDMQAAIGHTKHIGGWKSTREIVGMCNLRDEDLVLYVGSGSGLAAIRIAERFGCRIIGVDLMASMVKAAREWADIRGAGEKVAFKVGDAMDLPFGDDYFDIVLCESVNTFVPDLKQAMFEYRRVARPGGYIALNEAVWYREPSQNADRMMKELTGQMLLTEAEWIQALTESGLEAIESRTYPVEMKAESAAQLGFFSPGTMVRVIWRTLKSSLTDPQMRSMLKFATSNPAEAYGAMGYGLYVGRVPDPISTAA